MRSKGFLTLAVVLATTVAGAADTALSAFPGAEGFGTVSVGGRGGRVIKVTNLNATGPGSLQEACSAEGPRIVVFEVSGVIIPKRRKNPGILIDRGRITIAGQTAPGAGITIVGMLKTPIDFRGYDLGYNLPGLKGCALSDITVRFLRTRPGAAGGGGGDCLQFVRVNRLMIDHISCSGASDETVDINGSQNYTVQWCSIEASDTARGRGSDPWARRVGEGPLWKPSGTAPHNFGMILGYGRRDATVHHTLFAHHNRRAPLCGMDILDHRNNVIYDVFINLLWHPRFFNRQRPGKPFRANVVANFFKDGPSCPPLYPVTGCGPAVYAEGNRFEGKRFADGKGRIARRLRTPMPYQTSSPVTTHNAEDAYKLVLAHAGCLPRDAISKRNIEETRKGTGSWGRFMPAGGLMEGLKPAKPPVDSDNDGLPDVWEKAHNLNPNDPKDNNKIVPAGASADDLHKGYTYIEFYINELADNLIAKAIAEAGAGDIKPDPTWSPMPVTNVDVAAVAAKLADADPRERRIAAQALAAADPKKAVPALVGELGSKKAEARMCAMWALGRIGPAAVAAVPVLVKTIRDKNAQVPEPSGKHVSQTTKVRHEGQVILVRECAAKALAAIGSKAIPALVNALEATEAETRIAAAEVLGWIGPNARDAVPALVKRFKDEHQWARAHAALAVFEIAPDTDGLVEGLFNSLGEDPGKAIWKDSQRGVNLPYRLVWALGYMGPKAKAAAPKLEEVAKWQYGIHKISRPVTRVARWALDRIRGKVAG